MGEKRFKEYYQGKTIVSVHDTKNNNELVNILQCVDLLNRIADENEQLKKENELLKQDLEHCANQFKEDGKNVLLGLK